MVAYQKKIVWLPAARDQLKNIIGYIKLDSEQNAVKVKEDVLEKISGIIQHPEKFPPDKFKLDNPGSAYRAFEIHRIRVSYFIDEGLVMIIRIRHTKQSPLFY